MPTSIDYNPCAHWRSQMDMMRQGMIDDVFVGFEDTVRQPVIAHEQPDILDRVEFGTPRRQRHQGDVGRHDQFG